MMFVRTPASFNGLLRFALLVAEAVGSSFQDHLLFNQWVSRPHLGRALLVS